MRMYSGVRARPAGTGLVGGFGVYVHIPFCTRRCDYCAFATWADRPHLMPAYVAACRTEVEKAVAGGMRPASSVFFGGGTPSLLPADLLVDILAAIPRQPDAEVTVECNPETVDEQKLRGYREAGINRLSFGVQSMAPHVLEQFGTSARCRCRAAGGRDRISRRFC